MDDLRLWAPDPTDQEVVESILSVPKHYSANLVVDIGPTCDYRTSLSTASGSLALVGEIVDLQNADTNCNLFVAGSTGVGGSASGAIEIRVQGSDATTSGSFVDVTSGLTQFPVPFISGGIFFANSGIAWGSGNTSLSTPVGSGAPLFCSGGVQFAGFQRTTRYVRAFLNSGAFTGILQAGFISQKRTTVSGPGYSWAPGSGANINV